MERARPGQAADEAPKARTRGMPMQPITRRFVTLGGLAAVGATAACSNAVGTEGAATIDARVAATLDFLETNYPGTSDLRAKSQGILVMPLVTEAGLLTFGGGYGQGALLIDGITVDYYSATKASVGVQLGAQQYSHVLFFMTPEALTQFRTSPGWEAGADLTYAVVGEGQTFRTDTTTLTSPVIAVVFGQSGLIVGATLEGTKYTRIIP
jgi:lipid-binding SYLF domain-containing protein